MLPPNPCTTGSSAPSRRSPSLAPRPLPSPRDSERKRTRESSGEHSPTKRPRSERAGEETFGKREPLSVEDLLAARTAKEAADSQLRFISKKEREELEAKRKEEEEKQRKEREDGERRKREDFLYQARKSHGESRRENSRRDRDKDRDRDRDKDRDRDRDKDRDRDRERDEAGSRKEGREDARTKLEKEKEERDIKAKYFGMPHSEKKIRHRGAPKFEFDWDASDDTSVEYNALYRNRISADGCSWRKRNTGRSEFGEKKADGGHWKTKSLQQMTNRDWRILKEDFDIQTTGGNIPNPLRSWSEAGLSHEMLDVIEQVGYREPTPIQRQAIPIGLQNRDIIGVAETGSGKTAAFLIPLLAWIEKLQDAERRAVNADLGPLAIVMAPTRELARQIEDEANKLGGGLGVRTLSIIGGRSKEDQGFQMVQGCEIVVATPGRLREMLESRYMVLQRCAYVVLDEADKMISEGFEEDLRAIFDHLPVHNQKADAEEEPEIVGGDIDDHRCSVVDKPRQTTMFTATMSQAVERLAKTYLRRPTTVHVGAKCKPIDRIEQVVLMVSEGEKSGRLLRLLDEGFEPPVIVFVNHKKDAERLTKTLERTGLKATSIHGGKGQEQREYALATVKSGEREILVATNVAARGIDIKDVSMVVNYDMTAGIEEYTHRVGRTGRAGKKGKAVTFLTKDDSAVFYDLKKVLLESPLSVCPPELSAHPDAKVKPGEAPARKRRQDEVLYMN